MFLVRRSIRAVQPHVSGVRSLTQVSLKEKISAGISSLTHDVFQHVPSSDAGKVYDRMKGSILELMARNMSKTDKDFLLKQWGQMNEGNNTLEDTISNKIETEANVIDISPSAAVDFIPQSFPSTTTSTSIPVASEMSAASALASAPELKLCPELSSSEVTEPEPLPDDSTNAVTHPIFGKMLADVGYKKVYITSARRLVLAQVWQKQRTLRPERSAGIALAKGLDSQVKTGFPGVITLFRDEETGSTGIVDGQHRVGALLLMMRDESWPADELNVLIEVYSFQSSALPAVENLFVEINSAEPVKAIDMPLEGGDDDSNIKHVINEGVQTLTEQYPAMFKPTTRCRPPHIHADSLREDLYSSEYLQRKSLGSTTDLLDHFDQLNTQLSAHDLEHWGYSGRSDQNAKLNAIKKATKFKFFLGLSKRWLHE